MLRLSLLVFVVLLGVAWGQPTGAGTGRPVANVALVNPKMNPVTKVVRLLEEMKATIEKEAEEDQEMYDKMGCWCETNEKEKTEAIKIATETIDQLTSDIESGVAKVAKLETEIAQLKEDIAANIAALEKATAMREKERAEFEAETKDMMEALAALRQAVEVLSKVQLMQKTQPHKAGEMFMQVSNTIVHLSNKYKSVMQKDLWDLMGSIRTAAEVSNTKTQSVISTAQVMSEMLAPEGGNSLRGGPKAALTQQTPAAADHEWTGAGGVMGAKSYNSRSGQIFGILSQMKDEFASNLADAQKAETQALIAYHDLKAAKETEIEADQKSVDDKTQELADTNAKIAQAKQDLEDMQAALAADQQFLIELKEKCKLSEEEFAKRRETRAQEIVAIGETIKILTEDEARDVFSKTMSFLQLGSHTEMSRAELKRRDLASRTIVEMAKKHGNWALATLAVSTQLDAFTKVKKAMDDMVTELKAQQAEEYKKREFCKAELDQNEDTIKEKKYLRDDLEAKIDDLTGTIETLTTEIAELEKQVGEMEVQLKRAGEDRAKQNKEFQQTVADQRAVVAILHKALARLRLFYGGGPPPAQAGVTAFAQVGVHQPVPGAKVAPPPEQKTYQKGDMAAGGVMQMITMITEDAKRVEEEAVFDEQAAQTAYASFVSETNQCLAEAKKSILNKSKAKGEADEAFEVAKEDLKATMADLESLHEYNVNLHKDCDYVLKNFDLRQENRQAEIEAIQEAKAILSGAMGVKAGDFGRTTTPQPEDGGVGNVLNRF